MIERIVHLGFEVRVELLLADGSPCGRRSPREEAEQLELARKVRSSARVRARHARFQAPVVIKSGDPIEVESAA